MRKLISACALLLLCGSAMAQVETDRFRTYSPYSIFGIGERRSSWGTAETQSMAGVGASWAPVGVNNVINPASLSNLRQTTYTLGGSFNFSSYKDAENTGNHKDVYFDYLVFSVPLGRKSAASLGLMPYSSTGYSIYNRDSVLVNDVYKETLDYYDGNGGLNQVYLAYGRELFKNLNVGVNASYLFGSIRRTTFNYVEDRLFQNKVTQENDIHGFKFKFGLNYSLKLVEETRLYLGGTYEFSVGMTTDWRYRRFIVRDFENDFDPDNPQNKEETKSGSFSLPWEATVGVGVGNMKKWYVGLDVRYLSKPDYGGGDISTPNYKGVDFSQSIAQYQNSLNLALGASYTPQYNSPKSYLQRVRYQAGVYYRDMEYKLHGQQLNDMGITLGAALPMTKVSSQTMSISNFNLFLNFGMMGKASDQLVKQTYFKLGVSFSLNDTWFLKQKYY